MGVSKNSGKTPKMDGENNGKPWKMDDLGVPLFLETPIWVFSKVNTDHLGFFQGSSSKGSPQGLPPKHPLDTLPSKDPSKPRKKNGWIRSMSHPGCFMTGSFHFMIEMKKIPT